MRTNDATELTYARQKIVMVAKAYRIQAIDMVFTDYKGWYWCLCTAESVLVHVQKMVLLNVHCRSCKDACVLHIHCEGTCLLQKSWWYMCTAADRGGMCTVPKIMDCDSTCAL